MCRKCEESAFDKKAVYENEIRPLMDRVKAICQEHDIPMLAVTCTSLRPVDRGLISTTHARTNLPANRVPSEWQLAIAALDHNVTAALVLVSKMAMREAAVDAQAASHGTH